ncbi:uncharacterized protein LOC144145601 isoform X3 [Haemaphysalis longicornis]
MAGRARHCIRDRRAHETSEEHAARDLAAERRARRAELQRRRRLRERESTDPELVAKRQALAERARQYIRDRRAQETPEEHAARLAARRAVRPAQYRAQVNAETAEQRARRLEAARMAKRDSRRRRAQQKALQREPAAMIFNGKVTNEPFGYAGAVCAHPGPDDSAMTITITTGPAEEPAESDEEFTEIPVTIEMGIGAEVSLPSTTRASPATHLLPLRKSPWTSQLHQRKMQGSPATHQLPLRLNPWTSQLYQRKMLERRMKSLASPG